MMHLYRLRALGVLPLWIAAAAGCSDELPWQAHAAEEARELGLLDDVEVIELTREAFMAQAAARASQIDDGYLTELAETFGRLGYFDMDLDLRPIIAGSSSDWVGATYSPANKRVTLVGDADDDTIVHEFVHALQDQHFDLRAYDVSDTSDAFLGRRAVVEGDAVLAQYRFLTQDEGVDLDAVDWKNLFDSWRQFGQDTLTTSGYPVLFLDYVSFVYIYGLEYSAANLMGVTYEAPAPPPAPHDWGLQDELFVSRPPASTQQVLDRDVRGELGASDPVVQLGLRDVPVPLADRLTLVDWDTLGEWYTYLLLFPLEQDGTLADARALAAAWDGDTVLFARDTVTGEVVSVWTSAWEDEQAVAALVSAMYTLYGAPVPQEGFSSTAADGELVWIEPRGTRLVVVKNASAELAPDLGAAAFASETTAALRLRPSMASMLDRMRRERELHHTGAPLVVPE